MSIKKLLIPTWVITIVLLGCSPKPKTYSCVAIEGLDYPNSLSIDGNSASFNAASYKAKCKEVGNLVVFGLSQDDCDNVKGEGDYSVLAIDTVIYSAKTFTVSAKNGNHHTSYRCVETGK